MADSDGEGFDTPIPDKRIHPLNACTMSGGQVGDGGR